MVDLNQNLIETGSRRGIRDKPDGPGSRNAPEISHHQFSAFHESAIKNL